MPSLGIGRGLRLASQLSPSEVGPPSQANLKQWIDNSKLGLTNGAAVASSPDLSGNGNSLTEATGLLQPKYSTNKINGLSAVNFNAEPSRLTGSMTFVHPFTYAIILQIATQVSSFSAVYVNDTGTLGFFIHSLHISWVNPTAIDGAATLLLNTPYTLILQSTDATHIQTYVNGIADSLLAITSLGLVNNIGSDPTGDAGSYAYGESLYYNATVDIPSLYAYTKRWGT